jgi:16S rRNA G966 N2-methylase RsmD
MRSLMPLLRNRFIRAVKRRIFGSATLEVVRELERRGIVLSNLDALEVFGGTGDLHTRDYAARVKSLTVWEIDPALEARLRRNLPGAKIKITDSLAEMQATHENFQLVVIDAPFYVSESSLCEHFDCFPAIFRILADRAILVMNVMPEASRDFRAEFHVFHQYHLERRAQFYGSTCPERIPVDEMVETYRSLALAAGFDVDWYFSQKRGKNDVYFLVLNLSRCTL